MYAPAYTSTYIPTLQDDKPHVISAIPVKRTKNIQCLRAELGARYSRHPFPLSLLLHPTVIGLYVLVVSSWLQKLRLAAVTQLHVCTFSDCKLLHEDRGKLF